MIYTVDKLSGRQVREGELVTATVVRASNIIRDLREILTNTFGGRMLRYESLVDQALERATQLLIERAKAKGYDGVLAVRITNPSIVDGSAAVVIYGTGFNFVQD